MEEDINFVKEKKLLYNSRQQIFFWVCKRNEEERHEIIIFLYIFFQLRGKIREEKNKKKLKKRINFWITFTIHELSLTVLSFFWKEENKKV